MKESKQQIADYYNQTQNHYEKWWQLKDNMSLHYGIWDKSTPTFEAALMNTNKLMLEAAAIPAGSKVLDAGCGVGGAAIYLASKHHCKVEALSLSEKQIAFGRSTIEQLDLAKSIKFYQQDFTNTQFEADSFDLVWACESVCHCEDKSDFIKEAYRLLKPGGRLVMADFFLPEVFQEDPQQWIKKWAKTWGVPNFSEINDFQVQLSKAGFQHIEKKDYTQQVQKSAKKMYHASLLGSIPSELYNLTHPAVSQYAKTHYKSGIYQYKALKAALWKYFLLSASKPKEF